MTASALMVEASRITYTAAADPFTMDGVYTVTVTAPSYDPDTFYVYVGVQPQLSPPVVGTIYPGNARLRFRRSALW